MATRLFMGFRNGDARVRISAPGHNADNWSLAPEHVWFDSDLNHPMVWARGTATVTAGFNDWTEIATWPALGYTPFVECIAQHSGDPVGRWRWAWTDIHGGSRGIGVLGNSLRYHGNPYVALTVQYIVYNQKVI
jgi:hypothetical protein